MVVLPYIFKIEIWPTEIRGHLKAQTIQIWSVGSVERPKMEGASLPSPVKSGYDLILLIQLCFIKCKPILYSLATWLSLTTVIGKNKIKQRLR